MNLIYVYINVNFYMYKKTCTYMDTYIFLSSKYLVIVIFLIQYSFSKEISYWVSFVNLNIVLSEI